MRASLLLPCLALLAACSSSTEEEAAPVPAGSAEPAAEGGAGPWADAAARGVDFRGIGNEPGWTVEIVDGEQVTMVTDYGANSVVTPAPAPATNAAGHTVYRIDTDAHRLNLLIEARACQDAMSGEEFPAAVTATLDGTRYSGCGRALSAGGDLAGGGAGPADASEWIGRRLVPLGAEASAGSDDILERDLPAPYRVFTPGSAGDMMFNPDRLNVVVDANGIITQVYRG